MRSIASHCETFLGKSLALCTHVMNPFRYATFARSIPKCKIKQIKQERKTKTLTVYAHALYLSCDPEACEEFLENSSIVDRISVKQGPSTMRINYLLSHPRISLKLLIPLSCALSRILRTGPALSMLRIGLHELILCTHSIHVALPH